jgi:dolichyl-phosphate-mannose-protein mannosyltransferase
MRAMAAERRWLRVAVPVTIVALASVIRVWGLAEPPVTYWDEHYYVLDAEAYLGGGFGQPIPGTPAVRIADEGTWVHPPLGKWTIALLGVGPFGLRPFGWRFPSALFGVAGVLLLYFLALELWASVWWAGMAAMLLALDGLHIVQSRIAMLDVFLCTFITAGMLLLVLDRARMADAASRPPRGWVERIFGSPYRLGAGAALGAAVATKWSGLYALALAAALCAAWSIAAERRAGRSRTGRPGTIVASFVLAPLAVYLLSYGAFFVQHGPAIGDFLRLQRAMLDYQRHHVRVQPENSAPWTWPLLLHPIQYYANVRGGEASRIVALGNPVLWWGFLASIPLAAFTILRRPTWHEALIFGGYGAMFLPWLLVPRSQFIFYLLPAVPFMCLAVVAAIRGLRPTLAKGVGIGFASTATVAAAAYLPAWTGWMVPEAWYRWSRLLSRWPL